MFQKEKQIHIYIVNFRWRNRDINDSVEGTLLYRLDSEAVRMFHVIIK